MELYDFARSFVTFRADLDKKPPRTMSHKPPTVMNNARMQVACLCTVTNKKDGTPRSYVLTESCKSEQVGARADLFLMPNADMCMVASSEEFMVVNSWAKKDIGVMLVPNSLGPQPERHAEAVEDVFTGFEIYLHPASGRLLETTGQIVEATLDHRPLLARIEYDEGDYQVRIDHPVKTMNVNEVESSFQTDTGPILLPDLTPQRLENSKRFVQVLDHAFVAINAPDWAEFVVNVPTPLTDDIAVNHYSMSRRIDNTRNQVMQIG